MSSNSNNETANPPQKEKSQQGNSTTVSEKDVRPSVSLRMIRHAESRNNQVYRNARYIYRGGTPDFDEAGWWQYVETHREADPTLSDTGIQQATRLAEYLGPHLRQQASRPVHVMVSPMRRTLETIRPTIEYLVQRAQHAVVVTVNAFYYESDGCHTRDAPAPGLTPEDITRLLHAHLTTEEIAAQRCRVEFVGFPHPHRGWYCEATGAETRQSAEARAAKFYLWLCHALDGPLVQEHDQVPPDVFDAGVQVRGEETEVEFDRFQSRLRRRRVYLLVGHGDFMSLVLKRVMAGYGYVREYDGVPHRSAMVHFNTGMTELEYFGQGRFLLMRQNTTPHLDGDPTMLSGGSLKDGWSYIVPTDQTVMQTVEVNVAFADEMSDHVREQTQALRALYLPSSSSSTTTNTATTNAEEAEESLTVEQEKDPDSGGDDDDDDDRTRRHEDRHFVVQRGHQVVAVATYSHGTGELRDVAVQPGVTGAREALVEAVRKHARTLRRSGSMVVHPRTAADQETLEQAGLHVTDAAATATTETGDNV